MRNRSHSRTMLARVFALAFIVLAFSFAVQHSNVVPQLFAQDPADDDGGALDDTSSAPAAPSTSSSNSSGGGETSLFTRLLEAGLFWLLLFLVLSMVMVFFIIEHSMTIRKNKLIPEFVIGELEQKIARGEINEALEFCHQPENYCMASEVILAGLERFTGSEFGFAEYKTAVEEEGENQTGMLYRKTEVLGVIGAIAPMLGLTGTVLGMILAFNTIADSGGTAKPDELAGGIGTALITTLLGLVVAMPSMIAYSFFRNKIDSLVAEAGRRIERCLMPLGRKR